MRRIAFLAFFLAFPFRARAYFTEFETIRENTISVLDWTPPKTSMFIQSPTDERAEVRETIQNGSFDEGFEHWETEGHVFLAERGVAQLGSQHDSSEQTHGLRQTIVAPVQSLAFSYRIGTTETLEGFDDPAFMVTVDGHQVFSASWKDASSDWRIAHVRLPTFSSSDAVLQFAVQNTGDMENPTWVQLKEITTDIGLVNGDAVFSFAVDDTHSAQTYLQRASDTPPQPYLKPFSLTGPLPANTLTVWSVDQAENTEEKRETRVLFDQTVLNPLSVTSMTAHPHDELVMLLAHTLSSEKNTYAYTLRDSTHMIHPFAIDQDRDTNLRLFFHPVSVDYPAPHNPMPYTLEYRDPFGNIVQKDITI